MRTERCDRVGLLARDDFRVGDASAQERLKGSLGQEETRRDVEHRDALEHAIDLGLRGRLASPATL